MPGHPNNRDHKQLTARHTGRAYSRMIIVTIGSVMVVMAVVILTYVVARTTASRQGFTPLTGRAEVARSPPSDRPPRP